MEESQKRKERLKAMRIEQQQQPQQQQQQQQQQQTQIKTPLGNPLADNQQQQQQQQSTPLPRFDFYTDPLAAFSSNKPPPSRPFPSPAPPGSRNAEVSHSGAHQFQNSYSPHQNVHQGGVPYNNTCFSASPMGVRSPYHGPFPVQQGSPGFSSSPNRGLQIYSSPTPGSGRGGNPYPVHQGSPGFSSPPYRGPQIYNSPAPGSGRGGSPYPVHHGSPNFVPHTHGRGPWPNSNMPPPGPGRGRGWWDGGASSGSRNSGGRGRGHGSDGQGRSYYLKSMVQDPWESLTPVIWESHDDGVSFYSWGSIKITSSAKSNRGSFRNAKKARVHEKSKTGPSLAEFLAAAADEEDVDNTGTT